MAAHAACPYPSHKQDPRNSSSDVRDSDAVPVGRLRQSQGTETESHSNLTADQEFAWGGEGMFLPPGQASGLYAGGGYWDLGKAIA